MAKKFIPAFSVRRLFSDRSGNFTVMTALLLPVGLGIAGLAIDTTSMVASKAALQNAADSAALAAATGLASGELDLAGARALATKFVAGQMSNHSTSSTSTGNPFDFSSCTTVDASEAATVGTAKKFTVTVNTCYRVDFNSFSAILGKENTVIHVSATTEASNESKNALSMYLVLDRSGSMAEYTNTVSATYPCGKRNRYTCTDYYTKVDALRIAATNLMNQLGNADPTTTYVRTGAVSYNASMQSPTNLAWGESATKTYIDGLTATGGTDSSLAFKTAYQALMLAKEETEHANKNGQVPSKFIVFMTDGDNNYTSADTATKGWCDSARNNGIEVYTIAFMAPDRGKALLNYCATTADHYFAAEDASELNSAFRHIGEKATAAASRLTQ